MACDRQFLKLKWGIKKQLLLKEIIADLFLTKSLLLKWLFNGRHDIQQNDT
jgi:hypothetical protein